MNITDEQAEQAFRLAFDLAEPVELIVDRTNGHFTLTLFGSHRFQGCRLIFFADGTWLAETRSGASMPINARAVLAYLDGLAEAASPTPAVPTVAIDGLYQPCTFTFRLLPGKQFIDVSDLKMLPCGEPCKPESEYQATTNRQVITLNLVRSKSNH